MYIIPDPVWSGAAYRVSKIRECMVIAYYIQT